MTEPPTVLLVDDQTDIRLLWRLGFHLHGGFGAISEAADGFAALEMLEVERFDVVVTDFSMPDVSGFEVIDAALSRWPSTVVVMVSGTADIGDEALRRGASAFFDKHESTTERMPTLISAALAENEVLLGSGARKEDDPFVPGGQSRDPTVVTTMVGARTTCCPHRGSGSLPEKRC